MRVIQKLTYMLKHTKLVHEFINVQNAQRWLINSTNFNNSKKHGTKHENTVQDNAAFFYLSHAIFPGSKTAIFKIQIQSNNFDLFS